MIRVLVRVASVRRPRQNEQPDISGSRFLLLIIHSRNGRIPPYRQTCNVRRPFRSRVISYAHDIYLSIDIQYISTVYIYIFIPSPFLVLRTVSSASSYKWPPLDTSVSTFTSENSSGIRFCFCRHRVMTKDSILTHARTHPARPVMQYIPPGLQ